MEDLVGVGVADAAEEPRIGQRPLDGVILGAEPRGKAGEILPPLVNAAMT